MIRDWRKWAEKPLIFPRPKCDIFGGNAQRVEPGRSVTFSGRKTALAVGVHDAVL